MKPCLEAEDSNFDIEDTIAEEEALDQEMSPDEELRILSQVCSKL